MTKYLIPLICLSLLFFSPPARAETKTFIREYTYPASDYDNKDTCKTLALMWVKRLLLEELGTYLESHTEVVNFQVTKDQITTLTAGIVRTQIIDEKWDEKKYWLKAKMEADPDEVSQQVNGIRKDRLKAKELEELKKKLAYYQKDNERLRNELQSAKGIAKDHAEAQYNENIQAISSIDKIQEGYFHLNKMNLENALASYTEGINLAPRNDEGYYGRALTYAWMGKFEDAFKDIEKIIEIAPQKTAGYFLKSFVYQLMQNFQASVQQIDKAIAIEPSEPSWHAYRGYLLGKLGNKVHSLESFQKALLLGSDRSFTYCLRGQYYLEVEKDYRSAQSDFQKAARLDNNNYLAYYFLGLTWYALGSYQSAIENFNKSIQLFPNYGIAYISRADAYRAQGNIDQALNDCNKGFDLTPKGILKTFPYIYYTRATIFEQKKMYKEAIDDYSIIIELNPKDSSGYAMRSELFFKMKRYDDAISDLTLLIEKDPKNLKYRYWKRGLAYFNKGMIDEALRDCKIAAAKVESNYTEETKMEIDADKAIFALLSRLYLEKKDYRKSVESSSEVIRIDPNFSPAYALRGYAYLQLNQIDQAIYDYKKSCDLGNNEACKDLKFAYDAKGKNVANRGEEATSGHLRIFQPGDYINYKLTGFVNAGGVDVPIFGTAQYKVLSDTQVDYYGNRCKIFRLSMDFTAVGKDQSMRVARFVDNYFTQDLHGSLMIHGKKDNVERISSFVKTPSTGRYLAFKSPFNVHESVSQNVELTDGSSKNGTDIVLSEEQVSVPAGIFTGVKTISNTFTTNADLTKSRSMETHWLVPEIGPVRSNLEYSSDKESMKFILEMTDTNIPYKKGVEVAPTKVEQRSSPSTANEIGRDGRFIAYDNGTVIDTRTGLMWAAKDNGSNIKWSDAKRYCENYRGGGYTDWRMPTLDELAGLYDSSKSRPASCSLFFKIHVATELIDITCFAPWASETLGSEVADFSFRSGDRNWGNSSLSGRSRALPVRSGK